MKTESFSLPSHWAVSFLYGDDSGLDAEDFKAARKFADWVESTYGQCWCVNVEDDSDFSTWNDAIGFGVLPGMVSTFVFDVTPRGQ